MSQETASITHSAPAVDRAAPLLGVWLIEKLWLDSWENERSAAIGYSPEGYCATETEADVLVSEGGMCAANGWPLTRDTPLRRKVRLERLSPNDKHSNQGSEI